MKDRKNMRRFSRWLWRVCRLNIRPVEIHQAFKKYDNGGGKSFLTDFSTVFLRSGVLKK
jgi:hypothetical protein